MKYYLHRISHEGDVSYPLLENGLLSIGWHDFGNKEFIDKARTNGLDYIKQQLKELSGNIPRNCKAYYRFIVEMDKGDIILVPMPRSFSIYKVLEKAIPVSEINLPENLCTTDDKPIVYKNNLLYVDDDVVDLGFVIKVQKMEQNISRYDYADAKLTARMKIRQTNADITDLEESINNAINVFNANKPINLRSEIIENYTASVLNTIKTVAQPDKLENLILWYCKKLGASDVDIQPRNETDKQGDADVIATFENLKLILYIQAKFHKEETDSWAVEQISNYCGNILDDGYSHIAWVITTADKYNQEAIKIAKEQNVMHITGKQFAEMLLDVGFSGMNI